MHLEPNICVEWEPEELWQFLEFRCEIKGSENETMCCRFRSGARLTKHLPTRVSQQSLWRTPYTVQHEILTLRQIQLYNYCLRLLPCSALFLVSTEPSSSSRSSACLLHQLSRVEHGMDWLNQTDSFRHRKRDTISISVCDIYKVLQHLLIHLPGLFCPFAHRANLIRHLKGLTEIIDISIVKPYPKGDDKGWPGWKFPTADDPYQGSTPDQLFGSKYLHEVYFKEKKDYEGRYSVPVVWDKKTNQLVNNESLEILRNLNTGFNSILNDEYKEKDFYPENFRKEIDEVGKWMQSDLNTGVYKAGFAPDQATYDKNVIPVFRALNRLEKMLYKNGGPYILGPELTELDIRLYPTLIRFDTVYVQHFKCNLGTIRHDYPVLNEWMKNLYWNIPGFKETTDFRHIKENVRLSKSRMLFTDISTSTRRVMETLTRKRLHPWGPFLILSMGLKGTGVSSKLAVLYCRSKQSHNVRDIYIPSRAQTFHFSCQHYCYDALWCDIWEFSLWHGILKVWWCRSFLDEALSMDLHISRFLEATVTIVSGSTGTVSKYHGILHNKWENATIARSLLLDLGEKAWSLRMLFTAASAISAMLIAPRSAGVVIG